MGGDMQPGLSRAGTGSSSAPPYRKSPRSCIAKHPQETSAAEYGTHYLWFYEDINLLMHSFNTCLYKDMYSTLGGQRSVTYIPTLKKGKV